MTDLERARQTINSVDKEMAELFEKRMEAVKLVAAYKQERGIPVDDFAREEEMIAKNSYISVNHLCKLFKTTLGTTVIKYIIGKRISQAKKYLKKGKIL